MRWLVLALLLLASPLSAQEVRVTTGEHDGFTRIVLTRPAAGAWLLNRSDSGYDLRLMGTAGFDLSAAFDRINRRRLASLDVAQDGTLRLGVGCACHAVPFEYRPEIIVIDLRDGPPTAGSAFETGPDGVALPPLAEKTRPDRPVPRPPAAGRYDWLDIAIPGQVPVPVSAREPDFLPVPTDLAALRQSLLLQFSRAASQGLVDPALPAPPLADRTDRSLPPPGNLRIGDPLDARTATDGVPALAPDGTECPAPDRLAIEAWGDGRPAAAQLVDAAVLVGEFDWTEPEAVTRAVQLHLHLGFGTEALALLAAFPTDHPDAGFWRGMARHLDGLPDPQGTFDRISACDGPSALWSALGATDGMPAALDRAAVLRSFSLLPPHLRRHLGPELTERFLKDGDLLTATALLDAVLRLPGEPDDRATVALARLELARGGGTAADIPLARILTDPGPAHAPALIAMVDLHVASRTPLDPATIPAIGAHLAEAAGTSTEPALRRALILAQALAGDFDAAFTGLPDRPDAAPALWDLLAAGPDSAIILHAIGADPGTALPEARSAIATRLSRLGFTAEARRWSQDATAAAPPDTGSPLLVALQRRDWAGLPADAPDHWKSAVQRLSPVSDATLPPLARGRNLAAESGGTRAAIRDLLDAIPAP